MKVGTKRPFRKIKKLNHPRVGSPHQFLIHLMIAILEIKTLQK